MLSTEEVGNLISVMHAGATWLPINDLALIPLHNRGVA